MRCANVKYTDRRAQSEQEEDFVGPPLPFMTVEK